MAAPKEPLDKLQWAERHLKLFQREVRKSLGPNAYSITKKGSGAKGKIEWHLVLRKPLPSEELGLIAGDVIHALRSRLDHLAWTLAGGDPADAVTQFPICSTKAAFGRQAFRIKGLPKPARKLIEYLQPYRRMNAGDSLLAAIADLDNMDKHRTIPVVLSTLEQTDIPFKPSIDTEIEFEFQAGPLKLTPPGPFVLASLGLEPPDPNIKVKADFTLGVAFGDSTPTSIRFKEAVGVLKDAFGCVSHIVDLFRRLEGRAYPD